MNAIFLPRQAWDKHREKHSKRRSFSQVQIEQVGENKVAVRGATGSPAPDSYKVCTTYADQWRGGHTMTLYGIDADKKARKFADAVFAASRRTFKQFGLADFSETSVELIGCESQYGAAAQQRESREVAMKIAVKHPDAAGVGILLKEMTGLGLATPPGLSGFAGGRPKPSPIVRLFSFALPKGALAIQVELEGVFIDCADPCGISHSSRSIDRPVPPSITDGDVLTPVPLVKLAWARSGDKGDKSNIGIIARKPEYLPYIYAALTEQAVALRFAHFLPDAAATNSSCYVQRFLMPGINGINFLLHEALGGGGMASIRNDAQGKGFGQLLLDAQIPVSAEILRQL